MTASKRSRRRVAVVVVAAWMWLTPHCADAILTNVDDATDICPATSDPCVLTQVAEVVNGAVLDFGTRAFEVRSGGVLTIGLGSATVRCGTLTLSTTGTAVALSGTNAGGGSSGGVLSVEVRRRCSANNAITCVRDSQCAAVAAGTCTVGSGAATLAGKINGNADDPATLVVQAAGPISVSSPIQMDGTALDADGGTVELTSSQDAVSVTAAISLNGGGQASGGDLSITAQTDITVTAELDASGGDFDGGILELTAGRDLTVTADVSVSATAGGGFGGELTMSADRDLTIAGGTSANRVVLAADGHESVDLFGGDGGSHDYFAGRDMFFGEFTRLTSEGAQPDGFGDYITIEARGNLSTDGDIMARAMGGQGGGGEVELQALGAVNVSALSDMDVTGGSSGAGSVSFYPDGDLTFAGSIDASVSNNGAPGGVTFDSSADVYISGAVKLNGAGFVRGIVETTGCRLKLLNGTDIDNRSDGGLNKFTAHERIAIDSGAVVTADPPSGSNQIRYRTSAKPPVIAGQVTPYPTLTLDRLLTGCPVCGNNEIDGGETCDDGNAVGGDGCSAECQDEGCVADTPGYPATPLCSDGDPCTLDVCDAQAHACTNPYSCDDGIDCTDDACTGDACVHTPVDALCPSATPCAAGFCNGVTGCVFTPVAGPCNDGLFCNGADTCSAGACIGHAGNPCVGGTECADSCNETADNCFDASGTNCTDDGNVCTNDKCDGAGTCAHPNRTAGTNCTDDGNLCTNDACDGAGTCAHPNNAASCNDGLFCNGADTCTNGACDVHAGNPCSPSDECRDTCNESLNACSTDAGVPCTSDGNVCTDDACSGGIYAYCAHTPYDWFYSTAARVVRKDGLNDDRFAFKSVERISDVTVTANVSGLRFEVVDSAGASLYTADLPAAQFVDVKGDGSLYRFRDNDGIVSQANGIFIAIVKRNPARGLVYVRLKARNREFAEFDGKYSISPSLSFGALPGSGPCFADTYVRCVSKGAGLSCRD